MVFDIRLDLHMWLRQVLREAFKLAPRIANEKGKMTV
jgi:hypothetical protein